MHPQELENRLAKNLASVGMNLVLTGRNKKKLIELSDQLEEEYNIIAEIIVADLSHSSEVYRLVEETQDIPVNLFVASAGFGTSGSFHTANLESELNMLKVNTIALMMLTHYFGRKFANQGKGGIILMSSIVGFQGVPNAANYSATKAYVQSLAEGLYHELKPFGVDILAAAPGPVNSGFASVANMQMGQALSPNQVAPQILKALGKKHTVFPGNTYQDSNLCFKNSS